MKTKSVARAGLEPASLGVRPSAFTFRPPALLPLLALSEELLSGPGPDQTWLYCLDRMHMRIAHF